MGASEPKGSSRLGREGAGGRWAGPLGNEGRQVKPPCSLRETPSQPTNRLPRFLQHGRPAVGKCVLFPVPLHASLLFLFYPFGPQAQGVNKACPTS